MSGLRIHFATRNLHQGGPKNFSALSKTLSALQPDVLFVQECCDPQRYAGWTGYRSYWNCIGHGRLGSAILVRDGISYEPVKLDLPAFAGWMAAGRLIVAGRELQVINIHTPTGARSYSLLALEALAALTPVITEGPTIIGGDWNVTIAVPAVTADAVDLKGSRVVRAELNKLCLSNAWQYLHPYDIPPRTLRHGFRMDARPHHIDGFFLSPGLLPFLRSCEVLETADWLDSDHNPVVMALEF